MMNLVICTTPLQVVIACKTIEQYYPAERFFGIFLTEVENEKHKYYFKQYLCKKCVSAICLKDARGALWKILGALWWRGIFSINRVFLASVNIALIHKLLGFVSFNEMYTYDDGMANLIQSGCLNTADAPLPHIQLRALFGLKSYSITLIKQISLRHYTIFPDHANIVSPTSPVQLIDQSMEVDDSPPVRLMLGQSAYHDAPRDKALTERVIADYKVDYYFPHPKEQYQIEGAVECVRSPLIFEDYFIQHLKDKQCILYTYFSTAALNLSGLPNVQVISLQPQGIQNKSYLETYQLFEKLGIEVVHLPY